VTIQTNLFIFFSVSESLLLDSLINYYYYYYYYYYRYQHLGYVVSLNIGPWPILVQRKVNKCEKNKARTVKSADPREYYANVSSQMQINSYNREPRINTLRPIVALAKKN